MPGLSEYPKFIGHNVFCTEEVKFSDVDIGNMFFVGDEIYIRMNMPPRRMMPRNTACICSPDPGMCGLGLYFDSHDIVEVVTESSITLKGRTEM